jgi:hypothetical protein
MEGHKLSQITGATIEDARHATFFRTVLLSSLRPGDYRLCEQRDEFISTNIFEWSDRMLDTDVRFACVDTWTKPRESVVVVAMGTLTC